MDYTIKPFDALCALEEFSINGIQARYEDFGTKYDIEPFNAPEYGCGNMRFIPNFYPQKEILEKYNITEEEYELICFKLEKALSFGRCGWCI